MAPAGASLDEAGFPFKDSMAGLVSSILLLENPMFGMTGAGMGEASYMFGGFRPTRVNGCLAKSDSRPVVKI